MPPQLDLTGQKFGLWEALRRLPKEPGQTQTHWLCRCKCGTERAVALGSLRNGHSQCCGCESGALRAAKLTTHGGCAGGKNDYLYTAWQNIKARTNKPDHPYWAIYGGRGIRMHSAWLEDFASFQAWILDTLGSRPSPKHSLDRIENDGHYEPGNLRWATAKQQRGNQRGSLDRVEQLQREYDDLARWVLNQIGDLA